MADVKELSECALVYIAIEGHIRFRADEIVHGHGSAARLGVVQGAKPTTAAADAAMVFGNLRVHKLSPMRLQRRERAGPVLFHEATIADHVRAQDRSKPAVDVIPDQGSAPRFAIW